LSNKSKIVFGTPEVLIIVGGALILYNNFTTGIIFSCLGILASAIRFSLAFQMQKDEAEAREKLYQEIKDAATAPIQTLISDAKKILH